MPYLSYLAQALVAVVFTWAGAAKLRDVRAFARYLRELHVLAPRPSARASAATALNWACTTSCATASSR
jgi:hypothetical protein